VKKIIGLLLGMLLGVGAWAAPITYSGQLTYGFTFNDAAYQNSYANAYLYLVGTLSPDTSATVKMAANFRNLGAGFPASLTEYFVSQNIGKLIGADPKVLSLYVDMGVKDMTAVTFPISDFSMENVAAYDPGAMDVVALRAKIADLINVNAWINPMGTLGTAWNATTNRSRATVNAWLPIGPFNVSAWYASNGQTSEKGKIGSSIGVSIPIGPVSIGADLETATDLSVTTLNTNWGSAVQIGYSGFYIGAELIGDQVKLVESALEFQGTLLPWLGFNTGANFDMVAMKLDSAELGGWVKFADGLKFRFGYLVTDNGGHGYSMYCPNPLTAGGLFLKANLSF